MLLPIKLNEGLKPDDQIIDPPGGDDPDPALPADGGEGGEQPPDVPAAGPPREPKLEDDKGFNAREAMAAKVEARQIAEQAAEPPTLEEELGGEPGTVPANPQNPDAAAQPAAGKPATTAPAAPGQTIKLMVDGAEVEVPLDEATRDLQIYRAQGNRLNQLNQALDEVRALREGSVDPKGTKTNGPQKDGGEPSGTKADASKGVDQDLLNRVSAVVEELQAGDKDDATSKLAGLLAEEVRNGRNQADVETIVRNELARQAETLRNRDDLLGFVEQNELIGKSPMLMQRTFAHTVDVIAEDLKAIGFPDAELAKVRSNAATARATHEYYRGLQNADGTPMYPLMPVRKVLDTAGARTLDEFKGAGGVVPASPTAQKPTASAASSERIARKERIETTQPQSAGVRQATPRGRHEAPANPAAAVSEMDLRREGVRGRMAATARGRPN